MLGIIRRIGLFAVSIAFLSGAPVLAHDLSVTQALVVIKTDQTYLVDIRAHWDALALGVPVASPAEDVVAEIKKLSMPDFQRIKDDLLTMIQKRTFIDIDDERQLPPVSFPEAGTDLINNAPEPTVLGFTARMEGRVPEDAKTLSFGMSRAFNVVLVTIFDEASSTHEQHVLSGGNQTPPFQLKDRDPSTSQASGPRDTVGRYIVLGFEHILPKGLDHILFVVGLFLLSTRAGPLLWQISAFTIAHSFTLALSMAGVASLPPSIVEPLIALSIAYVAIENIFTKEMKPWRPFVVFAFGLLHGMGFAGVLSELGFPRDQFAAALIGFNVGVEFGQLAVVLLAFLIVGWFRNKKWYRNAIVIPASLIIAGIGLYWTVERVIG